MAKGRSTTITKSATALGRIFADLNNVTTLDVIENLRLGREVHLNFCRILAGIDIDLHIVSKLHSLDLAENNGLAKMDLGLT